MRSRQSLLFLALVSLCTACNWDAFFQDGETYFEGQVTYQDTGEAPRNASVVISGESSEGFSNVFIVSADTIPVDSDGFFEILIEDHPNTQHYVVQVLVDGNSQEVLDYNCNNNVNTCAGLQPDEEHSVIIQI